MDVRRKWSSGEDALLVEAYRVQASRPTGKGGTVNWHEVAKRVPGRDNKDCRKRYYNEHDGAVKKGTWSKSEDVRLEGLVREHGTQWAVVARRMETRSADQCSKRWNHSLKPELKRRPWDEQEDLLLMQAVLAHGHRWRELQCTHFPSRSANDVKNQHTILVRRGVQPAEQQCGCVVGESASTESSEEPSPRAWEPTPQSIPDDSGLLTMPGDQGIVWGGPDLESLGDDTLFSMLSNTSCTSVCDAHIGYGMWSGVSGGPAAGEAVDMQDTVIQMQADASGASTQRMTITVEDAEPEILTQVMDVLMRSRARVTFCRG